MFQIWKMILTMINRINVILRITPVKIPLCFNFFLVVKEFQMMYFIFKVYRVYLLLHSYSLDEQKHQKNKYHLKERSHFIFLVKKIKVLIF